MTVQQLINFYGSTGYNARRLAEAAEILKEMIDTKSTVCLTLAGAMTPIGIGRTISAMIETGFIDWIVSTGANVYHDLHFAYDLPVRQGHFDVDDDILYSKQIVRIYDVYIKEMGTLQAQDIVVQREIKRAKKVIPQNASTADIAYALGKAAKENSKYPEKSFLVKAYEHKVPVYMPAISDSSIGLNMLPLLFEDKSILPNVILDVAESAAILWKSERSGGLELGGGVPKNFFQQTGPALYQILKIKEGGQDYLIQITDARPDTGGLSGATLQEGKSWGKIKTSHKDNIIVYGDSSVYFPLLCSYVMSACKPRKQKQLYYKRSGWIEEMKQIYLKNKK
ncbi:MAG: deoxyhypusine synthase [Thermoproteota archaeon]|nr:deoxyhypusine synthase [Thermoproteota archaeon]